ncbi:hypothetical protein D9758_016456 [Tetrapyrgos nigripes]|uniref:Uncharacterized protein n=1 Tax=Tetrapyrgos nigripes TaxID=182062 RepID=A0A8H5CCP3_9AGAR|nr:hypothetical protein D9758_016456 [Tetrapyrgos nigripes]
MASQSPIPFIVGLALTREQLDLLARNRLGNDVVDSTNCGDAAYAMELYWDANGIHQIILDLDDAPYRYFYVVDVFPSFNGTPPQAQVNYKSLKKHRDDLGEAWNSVKLLSRRWPKDMPEPEWLYPKMHAAIERMQAARKRYQ